MRNIYVKVRTQKIQHVEEKIDTECQLGERILKNVMQTGDTMLTTLFLSCDGAGP